MTVKLLISKIKNITHFDKSFYEAIYTEKSSPSTLSKWCYDKSAKGYIHPFYAFINIRDYSFFDKFMQDYKEFSNHADNYKVLNKIGLIMKGEVVIHSRIGNIGQLHYPLREES